jgi:exodeoxyribonuclease V alpha subunit
VIARQLGVLPSSPFRYRARIVHVLTEATEDGHCFLPQPELLELSIAKLTIDEHVATPEVVLNILGAMGQEQDLMVETVGEIPLYCPFAHFCQSKTINHQKIGVPDSINFSRIN